MGGALGLGNVTPAAEFNFYVDPHAAAIVLQSGIPIALMGLHLTHQAICDEQHLQRLAALDTATGRAVHGMLTRPRLGGLERVQEKWEPVFRPDARQTKNLERDDDSKKSHPAPGTGGIRCTTLA
jgi:hypothetical protein